MQQLKTSLLKLAESECGSIRLHILELIERLPAERLKAEQAADLMAILDNELPDTAKSFFAINESGIIDLYKDECNAMKYTVKIEWSNPIKFEINTDILDAIICDIENLTPENVLVNSKQIAHNLKVYGKKI